MQVQIPCVSTENAELVFAFFSEDTESRLSVSESQRKERFCVGFFFVGGVWWLDLLLWFALLVVFFCL